MSYEKRANFPLSGLLAHSEGLENNLLVNLGFRHQPSSLVKETLVVSHHTSDISTAKVQRIFEIRKQFPKMIVKLEVTKEDIEPIIIMGLYHYLDLIGSRDAFIKR